MISKENPNGTTVSDLDLQKDHVSNGIADQYYASDSEYYDFNPPQEPDHDL